MFADLVVTNMYIVSEIFSKSSSAVANQLLLPFHGQSCFVIFQIMANFI